MSDRSTPNGGGLPPEVLGEDIPEAVLDELLIAFADQGQRPPRRTKPGSADGEQAAPPPASSTPATPATPVAADPPGADTPPGGDDLPAADAPTPPDTPPAAGDEPAPPRRITVITDESLDAGAALAPGSPTAGSAAAPAKDSVVVIEADDLPDAVVLGGDPTGGAAALDSGTPTGAGSARVDPRFRARRIAVRRAAGRKRLRWMLIGGAVLLIVVGVLALLASPLFDIDRVDVDGVVYADPAAVQEIVDSLHGEPILTADLDAAAAKLEQIPWIRDARVSMHFPHRVSIEIAERTPVAAFVGTDGRYRVVDADAFVVAVLDNQPVDYPPVTGVLPNTAAGSGAGVAVQGATRLIAALPPQLADRLESVALGVSGDLTLHLSGVDGGTPVEIYFGSAEGYRDKLIGVLNEMSSRQPGYSHIDVSRGGDPVVG